MFNVISSLFSFGSNTNQFKQIVLFDYKIHMYIYLTRCRPILEQMIDFGLVAKLQTCNSIEDFGNPKQFTSYDLDDVIFARSMLEKISSQPSKISIESDNDLKQIVKIIMKKYLMEQNSSNSDTKVSIEVLVPNGKKIQVVSYANETESSQPMLKDPAGSIESGETPLIAGVRELEEELGLIIKPDRLVQLVEKSTNKLHKFQLVLDEEEYQDYIKYVNQLDIDPEITMICIVE